MDKVNVQFLGSGDAFGSGGRFQTCIYVNGSQTKFLIDCGASSLIAMKRFDVDSSTIDIILLSHLHGDHFGGIPFIIRETQIISERTKPLLIVGPTGLEKRIRDAMEILFPGSSYAHLGFPVKFIELSDDQPNLVGSLIVTSYKAIHTKGTEPHSLRVEHDGRIIAYSGDTEWNENLIEAARDADLFICESFFYEKEVKNHLSYCQLMPYRSQLTCKRLILTHMSNDMLSRIPDVEVECAADGTRLEL